MDEDRKALAKQLGKPTTESLKDWTKSMLGFQKQAMEQQKQTFDSERDQSMKNIFMSGLNTTDHNVAEKCTEIVKTQMVAKGIRDWFSKPENGGYDYSNVEDVPLVKGYKKTNPDREKTIDDFIYDGEQICDPDELYEKMGWYSYDISQLNNKNPSKSVYDILYGAEEENPDPIRRSVSAVLGGIGGLAEGSWDYLKRVYNNVGDIADIATDSDKDFIEKFRDIFVGEIVGDTIGGSISDIGGGLLGGAYKGFTTQGERDYISDKAASFVRTAIETDVGQTALDKWNSLSDEEKKQAEAYLTYIDGLINLVGLIPAKNLAKGVLETGEQGLRTTKKITQPIADNIDNAIEERSIKNAIKNETENKAIVEEIANRVGQGETKDIPSSIRAMQSISKGNEGLGDITTFQEFRDAGERRITQLSKQVDENLSKYKGKKVTLADQKTVTVNGKEEGKVIEDAFNDLIDIYTKQRRPEDVKRILDLRDEVTKNGIEYKEFNDFIREYGREVNAWNKKNELTTDSKKGWENTRDGMKELLRERVPDEEFRNLDREMSDVYNLNGLFDTSVEKVNNLTKRLRKEGLWNKTVGRAVEGAIDLLDVITGKGVSRALAKRMLGGNSASKMVDFGELESELPRLNKLFDDTIEQLDKAKTAKEKEAIRDSIPGKLEDLGKTISK